jgi:hypothetical protein
MLLDDKPKTARRGDLDIQEVLEASLLLFLLYLYDTNDL